MSHRVEGAGFRRHRVMGQTGSLVLSSVMPKTFTFSACDLDDTAGDDQEDARLEVATTVLTWPGDRRLVVVPGSA